MKKKTTKKVAKKSTAKTAKKLPVKVAAKASESKPTILEFGNLVKAVEKYKTQVKDTKVGSAFNFYAAKMVTNASDEEVAESITDGSDDGQIDALYIENGKIVIVTCKYTEKFDKAKNEFPGNDLELLERTIHKLFNKEVEKNEYNAYLMEKFEEVWDILQTGKIEEFVIYVCSNMMPPRAAKQTAFTKKMKLLWENTQVNFMGLKDFSKIEANKFKKQINGEISFLGKSHFVKNDSDKKGIIATVRALDLIQLFTVDGNCKEVEARIFDDNIRTYLGTENKINKKIIECALGEESDRFWYLNNGVNLTCKQCSYPNSSDPKAKLTDIQIVNGGQTCRSIFAAYEKDPKKVSNIEILLKICAYENDEGKDIVAEICEASNSQTPVKSRDLRANDEIQKQLENGFHLAGYKYERKKNQFEGDLTAISSEVLGQSILAYVKRKPVEAKQKKDKVFGEYYDEIFDDSKLNISELILIYQLYKEVENTKQEIVLKKRKKQKVKNEEEPLTWATFHLLFLLSHSEEILKASGKDFNLALYKPLSKYFTTLIHKAAKHFETIYQGEGTEFGYVKFFKEQRVVDYLAANLDKKKIIAVAK